MADKDNDSIDFENLDDLPLTNHIEWDSYREPDVAVADDDSIQIWMARGLNIYNITKAKHH